MSDVVENFLSSRLPIGGVSAYSIHAPNGVPVAMDCLSKSLYPTSAEQMLTRLVKDGRALLPSPTAAHYCWTFEGHLVYVAARADGFCLALLVENNPTAQLVRIKETLQGFIDLTEV